MDVSFEYEEKGLPMEGTLWYVKDDYSFAFCPTDTSYWKSNDTPSTSFLLLKTLQIEVIIDGGRMLFAWGYSPMQSWLNGNVEVPNYVPGWVIVHSQEPLLSGVGIGYGETEEWETVYDSNSGWVQVRRKNETAGTPDQQIEIANGIVIALKKSQLLCI